jgi:alpha-ribazole phosphatase
MRLVLIRHPAPAIAPGICYGRLDIPLHSAAPLDALVAHPALHGTGQVWCSPAQRCLRVGEAIAAATRARLSVDPRLREIDFGEWEGQAWDTIDRADLDRWAACPLTFAAPGGETGEALIARVRSFARELDRDGVVVSHGGPLKVLAALLAGRAVDLLAPAPPIGSVTVVSNAECAAMNDWDTLRCAPPQPAVPDTSGDPLKQS